MSDEENSEFTINEEYAENYNKWRRSEELQKLKDKYGDVDEEEDVNSSSSSESEDEDADALTPEVEKDWFRAFAAVKSKNPKIYDEKTTFYHDETGPKTKKKSTKSEDKQPMFLKDYERQVILEKEGILSDSESSETERHVQMKPGYYEEQQEILNSLKEAVGSSDEEDNDTEFLTHRKKSKEELQKEEESYLEWLKGQKDDLDTDKQVGVDLASLKEYWSDPKLSSDEKFLRDFILNKRYLEEDEGVPTYDQIVEEGLSEEEEQLEKEESFEHKYNFRFEDPDPDFIKSYPRSIDESVRKKDTKRAERRQLQKDKKEKEKQKKKDEIKQLKNLKKREISDKIETLKEVTGNQEISLSVNDLEGDFDPETYDKMMKKAFNRQFYDADAEDEKPTWSEDEDLGLQVENWDNWDGEADSCDVEGEEVEEYSNYLPSCEEPTLSVDQQDAGGEETVSGRKKRKKGLFQKVVEAKKPVFDPGEKTFEEYLEEYYKLDYEDIIGDLPCRFKYRQTVSNDFGLSTDEVLSAREKELNQWVSVKKMSQYRTQEEEKLDVKRFGKKGRDVKKKLNILTSLREKQTLADQENKDEDQGETSKGKKKSKKRKLEDTDDVKTGTSKSPTKVKAKKQHTGEPEVKRHKADSDNKKRPQAESKDRKQPKGQTGKTDIKVKDKGFNTKLQTTQSLPVSVSGKDDKKKLKSKKKKQKLKLNKLKGSQPKVGVMSAERLKAYGINPKKFKYRFMSKRKS